ncbi:hypothetical protein [Mycolicibacterium vanbaalenii]|uniref:Uncharacterized protein n=1 Tax=Mycolicibacterium vanbaalenii (strain DSM 7251 / JCM 13017 / BCRC 16820 / KCTC 9966 / NRRL B-24157 / PYR-1) TaxID=350058 RepID=A1THX2_MYCVP|nr:hypothetical protein [Mycolicibacterium vanbaalenii]ABM16772.1 hypothetical protein Mvan_6017 [Mycolicibacterium vanbaalenii PYR-1]MCV7126949.1 hypothetical protein [Mycolicibacterium vanbaalenii PYR-1]
MCNPDAFTARYLEVLNDRLGWDATVDDDGDLTFGLSELRTEGGSSAWIDNHAPHDPEYLRVHTGFRLPADAESDEASLGALAADLSRKLKVAKVAVDGAFFIVSVEMLAAGPGCLPAGEHLAAVLPRARRLLVGAAIRFDEDLMLRGIESATRSAAEQQGTDR